MIGNPTVLILGAGASAPYGFPLGLALRDEILKGLRNKLSVVYKAILEFYGFRYNEQNDDWFEDRTVPQPKPTKQEIVDQINNFAYTLERSPLLSIDAFLERRTEFIELGKIAIAASLIPHEKADRLIRQPGEGLRWLDYVFTKMDTSPDRFAENKLKIITFNYDRTVEYFFHTAIQHSYNLSSDETVEIMRDIPIVHVYGKLGEPHYLPLDGLSYGASINCETIEKSVKGIKVIHEQSEEEKAFKEAHELLRQVSTLCFLGFGYHKDNLRRLRIHDMFGGNVIYGSTFGMGLGEIEEAGSFIFQQGFKRRNNSSIRPKLEDTRALDFLRNHRVF